ncbi:hypothetical protein GWK47_027068 [Chionoecetes opilio]|uniref:C2H2-type domain-containing protein n=1 Tax=Chionoecetes opilio TaxID=41210 RepID=A0A8J8WCV3_CHIOP|nr:hypothetical protein GWK47_027068 [Chionoecetes opilio]
MFCFKSFSNRGSMTRHLRDQHLQPGATVTCDLCGKVCKNRNCLITHRSVAHSGRRRLRAPVGAAPLHWPAQDKWAGEAPPLPLNYEPLLLRQEVPTDQAVALPSFPPLVGGAPARRLAPAAARRCLLHPPRGRPATRPHAVSLAGGSVSAECDGDTSVWYPHVLLRPKTYQCPFCDKCFTNRQSRSRHVHQKHAAGLAGTCTVCGHVYTNLQTRCAHTRVHARKLKP